MFQSSKIIVGFVLAAAAASAGLSCRQAAAPGNQATAATNAATPANTAAAVPAGTPASSPTEAYKMLFAAVRAKDATRIQQLMSKATLVMAGGAAKQFGVTLDEQLRNGMLETTITETLPEIRDERIKDNNGAVEVFNKKTGRWDETYFIKEDGGWKMAAGDLFAGGFKPPGKGQAQIEMERSNSANKMTVIKPNMNGGLPSINDKTAANGNVKTVEVPVERPSKKSGESNKAGANQ